MLCTTATLSAGEKDDNKGWVKLLQGDSFEPHWTTKGNWKLDEEGVATLTPRPGEKGWDRFDAYLWSEKQNDDFEIQFEYKVAERGNSGFYFNVADKANPVQKGIEVQIFDAPAEEGKKLTDHDSGGVIPGIPPTASTAKPAGEWNQFHITVAGDKLTVRLNGETVNKVNLKEQPRLKDRPEKGYIGFQDHSLPLALRNIRIRDLSSR
ncbi:MAG: DUF1080 domain-containing protein [Planctomycetes bacterium]|nr:DUF1080 domain-containing protein [Planctomycetota bacterium]